MIGLTEKVKNRYAKTVARVTLPRAGPASPVIQIANLFVDKEVDLLSYFFVDEEVCDLYSKNGQLTGPARGSGAGTVLAYLLGITSVDPIKYDLSLDRFLTHDRIASGKLPDLDLDLPSRDLLLEFLEKRYDDCYAQISVMTTLKLKNSIKDTARFLLKSVPYDIEEWTKKMEVPPNASCTIITPASLRSDCCSPSLRDRWSPPPEYPVKTLSSPTAHFGRYSGFTALRRSATSNSSQVCWQWRKLHDAGNCLTERELFCSDSIRPDLLISEWTFLLSRRRTAVRKKAVQLLNQELAEYFPPSRMPYPAATSFRSREHILKELLMSDHSLSMNSVPNTLVPYQARTLRFFNKAALQVVASPLRIAIVGNHLPRQCGIATFTTDLCDAIALRCGTSGVFVVAVNDSQSQYSYPPRVRFEISEGDPSSYRAAAQFINSSNVDLVCLQHEYGIFGGKAGIHILQLLHQLKMPVVTTLHTVLREPDVDQLVVMQEIAARSDRLIVMSKHSSGFLQDVFRVPAEKIDLIPHGIPDCLWRHHLLIKTRLPPEEKPSYLLSACCPRTRD